MNTVTAIGQQLTDYLKITYTPRGVLVHDFEYRAPQNAVRTITPKLYSSGFRSLGISKLVVEQVKPEIIDKADAVQIAFLLLIAGNATMVNMIELLKADPSLVPSFAEELGRYRTVSALAIRRTANDNLIKANEDIIASNQSTNRDADRSLYRLCHSTHCV
ncbi:NADP nitrous oxide-forming nitric oxide reductase [Trichoderma ghanense]|uniref:NADP nitrous oxide-forming nitric oxide reductase n=1 Tax=Trichoderma ghanense TaxID=65468 RepID=A0ABY2HCR8_9HYPO